MQQKVLHFLCALENDRVSSGSDQHPLLYHPEFDFKNLLQVLRPQGRENHNFIDAAHELRRELATGCFYCGAVDFLIKRLIDQLDCGREAEATPNKAAHLASPHVCGPTDD